MSLTPVELNLRTVGGQTSESAPVLTLSCVSVQLEVRHSEEDRPHDIVAVIVLEEFVGRLGQELLEVVAEGELEVGQAEDFQSALKRKEIALWTGVEGNDSIHVGD